LEDDLNSDDSDTKTSKKKGNLNASSLLINSSSIVSSVLSLTLRKLRATVVSNVNEKHSLLRRQESSSILEKIKRKAGCMIKRVSSLISREVEKHVGRSAHSLVNNYNRLKSLVEVFTESEVLSLGGE
jgi:hypothetical protein